MNIPQPVREMATEELRKGSPAGAVARRYSMTLDEVEEIKEEAGLTIRKDHPAPVTGFMDLIPRRLRRYFVCAKRVNEPWPRSDAEKKARADYDAGLVETTLGRLRLGGEEEDILVLYSIPRRRPDLNRDIYFANLEGVS